MIISDDGETIEFKSVSPYFERENDGRKCNTVRMFKTHEEMSRFVSAIFSLNMIRIRNPETRDSFERVITDITSLIVPDIPTIFIISWQSQE